MDESGYNGWKWLKVDVSGWKVDGNGWKHPRCYWHLWCLFYPLLGHKNPNRLLTFCRPPSSSLWSNVSKVTSFLGRSLMSKWKGFVVSKLVTGVGVELPKVANCPKTWDGGVDCWTSERPSAKSTYGANNDVRSMEFSFNHQIAGKSHFPEFLLLALFAKHQ